MTLIDQLDPIELEAVAHRLDPSDFAEHCQLASLGGQFHRTRLSDFLGKTIADATAQGGARIIINVGPRQGKSEVCCFATPTWFLDTFPDQRIILGTSTATLAEEFGRRVRDEFQHNPNLYTTLRDDSQARGKWNTDEGGGMLAVGSGKAVQGFGFNLGICDDLHAGWVEAQSAVQRQNDIDWFNASFMSRAEPGASVIVLAARMNRNDLSGYLMRTGHHGPWKLIKLPTFAKPGDPMGRNPGELVCPERWSVAEMEAKRAATPPAQWFAMQDQDPQADGEGRVYGSYSDANLQKVELRDDLPLVAMFDFNVNPGVTILIGQHDTLIDRIGVRHEVTGSRRKVADATRLSISRLTGIDINATTRPLGSAWRWPKLFVYGDRSGKTPNSQTTVTDYQVIVQVLQQLGIPFELRVPDSNPPVKQRVDCVNDALCDSRGERHLFIDPRCRESEMQAALVEDFEQLQFGEDGTPDKSDTSLSHASDALGYFVYRARPLSGPVKTTGGSCHSPPLRK